MANHIKFLKQTNITGKNIREYGDIGMIIDYIESEHLRNISLDAFEPFKPIKYKIVAPNVKIYKIKREIKRILEQIKDFFAK